MFDWRLIFVSGKALFPWLLKNHLLSCFVTVGCPFFSLLGGFHGAFHTFQLCLSTFQGSPLRIVAVKTPPACFHHFHNFCWHFSFHRWRIDHDLQSFHPSIMAIYSSHWSPLHFYPSIYNSHQPTLRFTSLYLSKWQRPIVRYSNMISSRLTVNPHRFPTSGRGMHKFHSIWPYCVLPRRKKLRNKRIATKLHTVLQDVTPAAVYL